MKKRSIISVFGSNQPQPDQPEYRIAYELGQRLAQAGYAVATGGYMGTMEAVSQGAAESGGHVIGVTCDEIESWRPVKANRWITEEIKYTTLLERLLHLVEKNDGVIVLPGGVGTLAEVALTWSQMQVGVMPSRPFILIGEIWQRTMSAFIERRYVAQAYQELMQFASAPKQAVELLKTWKD
ncbi:MAG: LOG family protein [Anaerolineales bacterium]|nr:LOG family protein [Anaerolineales bacterium]